MARTTGPLAPAEVQKHLKDVDFPATLDDLVNAARNQGAPAEVVYELQDLPDQEYDRLKDVLIAYARAR